MLRTPALLACFLLCGNLFAMGPDPGGHTGAGVTPETTRTDRPEVDAARKNTSGGKVESNPDKGSQAPRPAKRRD